VPQLDHTQHSDFALIEAMIPAVIEAGETILAIRAAGNTVETKADNSPVTRADRAAEAILLRALRALAPELPVVAEEEVSAGRVPEVADAFVAVDALDGTKDFLEGGDDFTVNVGLVRAGAAVAGVVFAPARALLWYGSVGNGAWKIRTGDPAQEPQPIAVRQPPETLDIVASKSHRTPETDEFIAKFPGSRLVAAGSSLKLVAVAEGEADLYPRLATTSQWDIAAGNAILTAAGGRVLGLDGNVLGYGAGKGPGGPHPFLNHWFVATGPVDPFAG